VWLRGLPSSVASPQRTPSERVLLELAAERPEAARRAEGQRRLAADRSDRPLVTRSTVRNCKETNSTDDVCQKVDDLFAGAGEDPSSWHSGKDFQQVWDDITQRTSEVAIEGIAYIMNLGFSFMFPFLNFVQGFPRPGWHILWQITAWFNWMFGIDDPKFKPPVKGETMGVVSYQEYAETYFGKAFPYSFFEEYYTGTRIPSWEDNVNHKTAITLLDTFMSAAHAIGVEPMDMFHDLEPRFALDNEALVSAGWAGFQYLEPHDIKYASNGVWGIAVIEKLVEKYGSEGGEVLGPLMTDSVFSVHLRHDGNLFYVDMTALEKYRPITGYAPLGGKAAFKQERGSLHMVRLEYNGSVYTSFEDPQVAFDYQSKSKRSGWRLAEAALISSLLSMTNLVLHVKDLHLELAAAFQAVTVDAFATDPTHPLRRLLDPFIHRSVQATNDNFKLLFEYNAAEFSLAPLPVDEQLRLIDDFIRDQPLNLAEMDMERFGDLRNMSTDFSTREAIVDTSRWGWRWHYRSLMTQRLYDELIECRLGSRYGEDGGAALAADEVVQTWWTNMVAHMPALKRATRLNPEWAPPEKPDFQAIKHVLRVLIVWLSWIHEDVGHSAASYVYNPVYTPMCVPEDGVGVPARSFVFNTAAYRGFVFLERAALLDGELPAHWFDTEECSGFWWFRRCHTPANDPGLKCFQNLQNSLRELGQDDIAFSECDKHGFYSCVERVETAVSS